MSLRIGWDLDGVVYPCMDAVAQWIHRDRGVPLEQMPMPDQWNAWDCWGMTAEDWWLWFDEGILAGEVFAKGQPEAFAVFVNQALRENGHTQHVITARCATPGTAPALMRAARANTYRWFAETGFTPDTVEFSNDKSIRSLDVMIEDNLGNYDALDAAGVHAVLMDRPYNQDGGQRRRVHSLLEFLTVVDELDLQRQYDAGLHEIRVPEPV